MRAGQWRGRVPTVELLSRPPVPVSHCQASSGTGFVKEASKAAKRLFM